MKQENHCCFSFLIRQKQDHLSTLVESVDVLNIFNHSKLIGSIRGINVKCLYILRAGDYPIRNLCSDKKLDIRVGKEMKKEDLKLRIQLVFIPCCKLSGYE